MYLYNDDLEDGAYCNTYIFGYAEVETAEGETEFIDDMIVGYIDVDGDFTPMIYIDDDENTIYYQFIVVDKISTYTPIGGKIDGKDIVSLNVDAEFCEYITCHDSPIVNIRLFSNEECVDSHEDMAAELFKTDFDGLLMPYERYNLFPDGCNRHTIMPAVEHLSLKENEKMTFIRWDNFGRWTVKNESEDY